VGEVGEGVPICGGDDEPAKIDVQTRWRCMRHCNRAPPMVPAISPCHRVGEEEEAGEVDTDIEAEARGRGRWATQSRSVIEQKKIQTGTSRVVPGCMYVAQPVILVSLATCHGQGTEREREIEREREKSRGGPANSDEDG
jgi:hypothetical protein